MTHLLVLDMETGGLDPEKCAILSFCAKLLDDGLNIIGIATSLVRPKYDLEITAKALEVNKLSVEECRRNGLNEDQMIDALDLLIKSAEGPVILAGSNPKFDRDFYEAAGRRLRTLFTPPNNLQRRMLDTGPLCFADAYRRTKNLDRAAECQSLPKYVQFRQWNFASHTAEGDVDACIEVIREQFNEHLGAVPGNNW